MPITTLSILWKHLFRAQWHRIRDLTSFRRSVLTGCRDPTFFTADDEYFEYFDLDSAASIRKALSDLESYMTEEGPFDGVLAFSLGGALAATLLIDKFLQQGQPNPNPPFQCAFFLSTAIPYDPTAILKGEIRKIGPTAGPLIQIPTAHIWGSNDDLGTETCPVLRELCSPHLRTTFVHDLGHDVPGARSQGAMNGTVRAIRRTIDQCASGGLTA